MQKAPLVAGLLWNAREKLLVASAARRALTRVAWLALAWGVGIVLVTGLALFLLAPHSLLVLAIDAAVIAIRLVTSVDVCHCKLLLGRRFVGARKDGVHPVTGR